ncbi:MAG: ABC transporter permease [Halofilum sp. (in: g-proteobacteria)]
MTRRPETGSSQRGHASAPGDLLVEDGGRRLVAIGDWTLAHYRGLQPVVARLADNTGAAELDLRQLGHLDTAGAVLLARLVGPERLRTQAQTAELPAERRALLQTVAPAAEVQAVPHQDRGHPLIDLLAHLGAAAADFVRQVRLLLGFIGIALVTLIRVLPRPRRWRINALVNQIEQTGLNAVPIVALLTFLVGAVVAFLGATVLAEFGAAARTVDLVAYAFMRELGVVLAAILLAGRTASAYTAQIGSMKLNEEIDALRVQGLDPIELLVLPRMLALTLTLPLLTFVAMVCGIAGGAAVAMLALDIPGTQVLGIVHSVPPQQFLLGMVKAPVFAAVIALIGCMEGFRVDGSAESVGAHTTSSVVQAIFAVIVLDAVAALFFMEMGW